MKPGSSRRPRRSTVEAPNASGRSGASVPIHSSLPPPSSRSRRPSGSGAYTSALRTSVVFIEAGWNAPGMASSKADARRGVVNGTQWPRRGRGSSVGASPQAEAAMSTLVPNVRPEPDQAMVDIADYVTGFAVESPLAWTTARHCLLDTVGCGLRALEHAAGIRMIGRIARGTVVPKGARVPGTGHQRDPVQAGFNMGAVVRWLEFNDPWLAAEWGHPSDNLGGILAVADWL